MQTITTTFLGPTDKRGRRYKAKASGGMSLTLEANDRLGLEGNHERAARALINKLGWFNDPKRGDTYGDWYSGGLNNAGDMVFVCCVDYAKLDPRGDK